MARIVVIEDETALREDIELILQLNDYEVHSAANGREGLEMIRHYQPDLVVSDVMMPHLDGHELLKAVRQDTSVSTTPFIFLTAKAEPTSIRHGMELGADDYLPKPFSSKQLTRAVNTQLKKREMIEERFQAVKRSFHSDLFFVLPHEINTPLNGILGLSDLILQERGAMPQDEVLEFVGYIVNSAERLHHTLGNVLLYAQIELRMTQPDQVAAMRRHSSPDVFIDMTNAIQLLTDQNARAADVNLDIADASVQVSSENLQKITIELLSNALKFSAPHSPINITGRVVDDQYEIIIADHGRGMTPKQIASVGPYQQFERKLYEQQGTGLGLAIVSKLVTIYGGSLELASNEPQGLVATVRLPLHTPSDGNA